MTFKNIFSLLFVSFSFQILTAQTQPASQPTDLIFLGVKAYGMSLSFQSSDAAKYLVLRSTSAITAVPVDGTVYKKGEWIGNGKVIGNITNSFTTFRQAVANTEYFFAVFAYNDNNGANPNYLTTNPLTGSVVTSGKTIGNYYKNYRIDTDESISDLSNLLYNHIHKEYTEFDDEVDEELYARDTIIGGQSQKYVICEYSDNIYTFDEGTFDASVFNKEHVLAKSWMPGNVDVSDFPGSDYHNLFMVKASVNSKRFNHPQGDVVNESWSDISSKYGTDVNGDNVFEPKENIKGNVARTMFYGLVTYDKANSSWAFNDLDNPGNEQDVDLLLQWHNDDPVDNFEIARNEFIYGLQENRNPFVDFPEWVSCIDFKTLTLNGSCPLDTAQNVPDDIQNLFNAKNVSIYPNPVKEKSFVKLAEHEQIVTLSLSALNGQAVSFEANINQNIADINLSNLIDGIYILKIQTKENIYIEKLLLAK